MTANPGLHAGAASANTRQQACFRDFGFASFLVNAHREPSGGGRNHGEVCR
jgi:hypothetical protein